MQLIRDIQFVASASEHVTRMDFGGDKHVEAIKILFFGFCGYQKYSHG